MSGGFVMGFDAVVMPLEPGESLLQRRVKELAKHHGSMWVLGRVLEVDHAYLYRLSTGEKNDPGEELLRKLKLRRVVSYEPIPQSSRSK